MSEPVKRYYMPGLEFLYDYRPDMLDEVELVLASDFDALAQRCRELDGALEEERGTCCNLAGDIAEVESQRDTLRAEVADLKARLLEAERGAEELVRLRAESRELRELLAECAEYLNTNDLTIICHGSILHRKMMGGSQ